MLNLLVGTKMWLKHSVGSVLAASVLLVPSTVEARPPSDSDRPRDIMNYHMLTDTGRRNTHEQNFRFFAEIKTGRRVIWAGELYLAEYNGARIEMDLRDVNPKCDYDQRRVSSRNIGFVLSLNTVDLVDGYRFHLKTYLSRRAPQCDEQRNVLSWLNVPVEIEEGETKAFDGDGGLQVTLTRKKWEE